MNWFIPLLLCVAGILFIAIELLFAPGITVFSFLGAIALGLGIIVAFISLPFNLAVLFLFASLLIVGGILIWFFKWGLNKRLALHNRESKNLGFKPYHEPYENYLGKTGITKTPLRPSGLLEVENQVLSVVSEGGFINQNEEVKIIKVEGNKIVVRKEKTE